MNTGMDDDVSNIKNVRKTAVIDSELYRLQVDIAALQETRLAGQGSIKEKDYTFFWCGKSIDERRDHGVGFAVKNSLLKIVELGEDGNERLLTLRLHTTNGTATLVSAYAPTLYSADEVKDAFYERLHHIISKTPKQDHLILLGDFNARVGTDYESWTPCLGKFGIGKQNSNGLRLLELCTLHNLCVTNSFFQTKPLHKVSWRHPRSKHWHQLDLVIVRKQHLNNVLLTRSYHSADCDSDHSLVCCKMRLTLKKRYKSKEPQKARLDISKMCISERVEQFSRSMKEFKPSPEDAASSTWNSLRDSIYKNALETFGKRSRKSCDWFEDSAPVLLPLVESKRQAFLEYANHPNPKTLGTLRAARKAVQRTARKCANEFWLKLSDSIQKSADRGDAKSVFSGLKRAFGPAKRLSAPVKSSSGTLLHNREEQMERWVEHFSLLYSKQNVVCDSALDAIQSLPVMHELDTEPTLQELDTALTSMSSGKAPGSDGIPPDLLKHCKKELLPLLHDVLIKCWREGSVPQDMKDCNIITLYKNKGARNDCNNYRGISLLSVVGKLIARVILVRLQLLAEKVYPESQCGFRAGRSTTDMVFSIRQLQEKCREQQMPLYMAFIDLTKAFDLVSREGLLALLLKIGCPPKLFSVIKSFHTGTKATVQYDGSTSEPFTIRSGVKQGCVLAPTLFGIFFSLLLKHAFGSSTEGVYLHTRSDGNLFKPARLKARRKVRSVTIRDMLFADDAAIVAHSEQDLQALLSNFANACDDFGLSISKSKTKILSQGTTTPPEIVLDGTAIEVVQNFVYLGSNISSNVSLDTEINSRIGKAFATFARLSARVWENPKLKISTKVAVYSSCVLSTLLYSSETWATTKKQETKLNSFHFRCLRRILGISWMDKITNEEVLKRTCLTTLPTLLKRRRLRWLGHVSRMEDGRIPKDILYGELASGNRAVGRPLLRFRDVVKRDLSSLKITDWENIAANRAVWRSTVYQQLQVAENNEIAKYREKRRKRTV